MRGKIIVTAMFIVAISTLSAGCLTTTQKSTAVGTGAGAALGAGVGALAGNAGMGALIGAGAGAVGGALTGDHLDKKREEQEKAALYRQIELEKQKSSGQGKEFIDGHYEYIKKRNWVDTSSKERVWVDERFEGERRIEGHYEERNVPSGHWQEYEEKIWIPGHYE